MFRPEGSKVWTAQAMQGSKEWNGAQDFEGVFGVGDRVLEERGFVGAGVPLVSRGLAFQVVGTTAW
jgi:hypothetical protein